MVDERSSLTTAGAVFRSPKYGSTNDRKVLVAGADTFETKQKYRRLNEDDMHYNYEADLMLDSVNRRYKKIVLSTYASGMAMIIVGILLNYKHINTLRIFLLLFIWSLSGLFAFFVYTFIGFLRKLWKWKSAKKTEEEILEEGSNIEQDKVTVVTYALCFIMMLAGLSVKIK